MWRRDGPLCPCVAFGFVVGLLLAAPALASAATASPLPQPEPPTSAPSDDTLLPPAAEADVSIVPTDQNHAGTTPSAEPGTADATPDDGTDSPGPTVIVLVLVTSLGLTALAVARLVRMLFVWRSPLSLGAASFGPVQGPPRLSFSLLVPARRAGSRLGLTLDRLASLDHPSVEVLVVVPYDDPKARAATLAAALRNPGRVRMIVDRSHRKARAAGLNTALAESGGDIVGVIEPGDLVHPRLLHQLDTCFADDTVAAVQGGIRLVASTPNWFSARHTVERYFWSRSRLYRHAARRFTPLEGSTAFVRADVLLRRGGWDEDSTAEGCDLGIRLSVRGERVVVAYSPELATQQDAPTTTSALLAERTRWIAGFVQVLRRGVWRRLPRRAQRRRARLVLAQPLLGALTGLVVTALGVGVATVDLSPALTLALLLPTVPVLVTLGVEMVGLAELGRMHDQPARVRDHLWLVASAVPYQALLAVAAVRVVFGQVRPGAREATMPVAASRRRRRPRRLEALAHDEGPTGPGRPEGPDALQRPQPGHNGRRREPRVVDLAGSGPRQPAPALPIRSSDR